MTGRQVRRDTSRRGRGEPGRGQTPPSLSRVFVMGEWMSLGIAAVASGVGAGAGFTSPPQPRRVMGVWWDYGEECVGGGGMRGEG